VTVIRAGYGENSRGILEIFVRKFREDEDEDVNSYRTNLRKREGTVNSKSEY
jgi:hypothetical protein